MFDRHPVAVALVIDLEPRVVVEIFGGGHVE
jgi:hypothetical protein